jgi:aspartate kinase
MKVLKFGGTSVGSAQNMRQVANILQAIDEQAIIVLSAMSGTTNVLVNICNLLKDNNQQSAFKQINILENNYSKTAKEFLNSKNSQKKAEIILSEEFETLRNYCRTSSTHNYNANNIVIRGEFITCRLFQLYIQELNISSNLIHALDFIRTDKDNHPDYFYIQEKLSSLINSYSNDNLFITQGFACINAYGEVNNLGRGGSDFTATIIGSVLKANIVEIWTDIDGLHNNDPRFVEDTYPIRELSYEEAEELAYFGAKILHPTCIKPVKSAEIAVVLKNTFNPKAKGTLIHKSSQKDGIKALAAKDNIIAINIKSGGMMMAYGFLRKIFAVFEDFKCSVDMITTSEIAVSVTIEQHPQLEGILKELKRLGDVKVHKDQSIICLVGAFNHDSKGTISMISQSINGTSLRMISYGASENNICLLVDSKDKIEALNQINKQIFRNKRMSSLIL